MSAKRPEKFLILIGPTGVGKTGVSIELARVAPGEIVSADSRLLYRMMDIGTAKPDERIRQEIPHHMIDVAYPNEDYTCRQFERMARHAVRLILRRGKLPIVVGGSGLYVRALTDGIFDGPGADEELRLSLHREAQSEGTPALWRRLSVVDSEKARQIDPQNLSRLIRALEVYELTGRPMSELERTAKAFEIRHVKVGLRRPRHELYRLIDQRVEDMMEAGFLDEVKGLLERGYENAPVLRQTLGYREILTHLDGALTLDEAVRLIKRNTRHYAKRQMTWFRKESDVRWLDITGCTDAADYARIAAQIKKGTDPFFAERPSPP